MTIDRWGSMTTNTSVQSQVAVGTACAPCKAKGHWCPAYEIIDGRALCLHCVDGVACPKTPRDGVADAPKPKVAATWVRSQQFRIEEWECEDIRRHLAGGKSFEWIAAHYHISKIQLDAITAPKAEPPNSVQPALAPGAMPSAAMPARRVFVAGVVGGRKPGVPYKVAARERAKAMLIAGMSLKATAAASGLSKNTVSRVRAEMPGLPRAGKGGVPKGRAAARRAEVDAGVSVKENGMEANSKQIFSKLAEEHAVFAAPAAVMAPFEITPVVLSEGRLAAASEVSGYAVVDMSMVPARKPQVSSYDEAIAQLKLLPMGKALMRSFADEELAITHREGICRRARVAGMSVCSKHDGATIWVWRKA